MGFKGRVLTEWLQIPEKKHRKMFLQEDFSFTDSNGKEWTAPTGTITNGISYPQYRKKQSLMRNVLFGTADVIIKLLDWSPFIGNSRRASVIHDRYCDLKTESSTDTHNMFYEAMLEDLEEKWRADIKYWAVRTFKKW